MQMAALPLVLALANTGKSIAARMPMIAITTSNSINVKPRTRDFFAGFIATDRAIGCSQTASANGHRARMGVEFRNAFILRHHFARRSAARGGVWPQAHVPGDI
jgi:hypothetical protein